MTLNRKKHMRCVFLTILALGLMLSLCACGQKASAGNWQTQYDLGVRYLSEGNYEEAIIAFTAAIEIDPKRPEGYSGLADAYLAAGDTESALAALEKGAAATGDQTLADRLAQLQGGYGQGDEALSLGWELYEQGLAAHADGDHTGALELLDAAIAAFEVSGALDEDPYALALAAGLAVRVCYDVGDIHRTMNYFKTAQAHMDLSNSYHNDGVFAQWGGISVADTTVDPAQSTSMNYMLLGEQDEELLNIDVHNADGKEIVIYEYNGQAEVYENGVQANDVEYDGETIAWSSP